MSAPVVRATGEEVQFTVHMQNLSEGRGYRLGLGAAGDSAPDVTVELMSGDSPVSIEATQFVQTNTSHWWGVPQVTAKGVQFEGAAVAGAEDVTFRVSMSQEEADQYETLYIFVSRNYGSDTWYLEDGSELDQSYW